MFDERFELHFCATRAVNKRSPSVEDVVYGSGLDGLTWRSELTVDRHGIKLCQSVSTSRNSGLTTETLPNYA